VKFYYDQKEIRSSNPEVAVTYYTCTAGRTLAVIGNLSAQRQTASIDLGGVKKDPSVTDEYEGKPMIVSGSSVSVDIPARHFMIIGL
ncbi:MAG: hypothetical protein AABZ39_02515, partial [Spirochaetota bacterium]